MLDQTRVPAHRPAYLPSPEHDYRLLWSLLMLFALVLLGLGIGLRDPWPADEPRFALNALEMLDTGQFWFPHRGGELYPDKPPVFMWLTALSIAITGSVRMGFLLPTLLASLGVLALVVDLTRRLHGPRIALLSGVALLSTLQFVLQAKTAQIDMVLTFFTTLGAYGLLRHALLGPARRWWLIAWAAMGLGIITKGVGFLPLSLLPAWVWLARRGEAMPLTWKELGLGLAVLTGVIALWGLPMIMIATFSGDPLLAAYRDNILFKQTGERYADAWHHHEPWYYYLLEVLPWAWLPLVLTLPWAAPAWWRRARRGDARVLLPLSGVVLIVLFFSLSAGKRGVYMLPTVPLLVLALAPLLPGLLPRRGLNWLATAVLTLLGGLFLVAGLSGWLGLPALSELSIRYGITPWAWWVLLGLVAAGLLAWLRPRRGVAALALWLVAFWASWSTWGYLLQDPVRSPRDMMTQVAQLTGDEAWLALPSFDEEFLLQARQPSVHFGDNTPLPEQFARAFHWMQQAPESRWMLAEASHLEAYACVDMTQAKDMGPQNSDEWWLVPGQAVADCEGNANAALLFVAPTTVE
ncbi:ArnT family glycosyltransferase [Modicisalibacter luteus]|uniref:ArnT family glycosyltransferase n=1 Tax=Modicisalibacter luteus TaxID=453962 RepID=A0ABV7M1V8_9GAMM|nr:glycosyltransferase family 39 protein [Halomonas lutea]GHB09768.1 glycosyl transferase [Halomonas lutea]